METSTSVVIPAASPAATFEVIATIYNVKVAIPARGSKWRVGLFNTNTKQVKQLGQGEVGIINGLTRKSDPNEDIFFLLGMVVKSSNPDNKPIVFNRYYHNVSANDLGRTSSCTVEIGQKTVGEKKYTSISVTKTGGPYVKEMKFGSSTYPEGAVNYRIEGTDSFITILSLQ
jgi:hypothetical protein